MSAIIADGEPLLRGTIRRLLQDLPEIEIAGEAADGRTAVKLVSSKRPDLLFLNVEMRGMTGFQVLEAIPEAHLPIVIFVSAHNGNGLQAIEVRALENLIRLVASPARAAGRGALAEETAFALEAPLSNRIAVRDQNRVVLIDLNRVDWIEAKRNYSTLHVGERSYVIRRTLAALAKQLDSRVFVRIHRSAIVNSRKVQEVLPKGHSDYELVLKDGSVLKLSRSYRNNLFASQFGKRLPERSLG